MELLSFPRREGSIHWHLLRPQFKADLDNQPLTITTRLLPTANDFAHYPVSFFAPRPRLAHQMYRQ